MKLAHRTPSYLRAMKEQKGFALIEVIIIGAIASIVMLGIMSMFNNLNRSQISIRQSGDFEDLVLLIKLALQNPLTCPAALQDSFGVQVAPPASLTAAAPDFPVSGILVSKISIGALLVDTSVPYNGMYIQTIKIEQVVAGSPANASPIPYTTRLRITGSKTAPGAGAAVGGGVLTKDIPLSLTMKSPAIGTAAATIISCKSKEGAGGTSGNMSRVTLSCTSNNCRVACPSGKVVLTGGCRSADNELSGSYPSSDTTSDVNSTGTELSDGAGAAYSWTCYGQGDDISKAFVVCIDE